MTQLLRFCMVTTFYPPYHFGGDAVFVHRLANVLAECGHHVDVIHCVDAYLLRAGQEPTQGADNHPNVTVHSLRSPLGPLSPLLTQQTGFPLLKTRQIQRILGQGFDVIHYHNISLIGGPAILAYGQGIKLYTMHEYWLVCPTHILFKFDREPCVDRQCLACQLVYKRPPQWWRYSPLLAQAVQHVDLFLAPSRFTLDTHQRLGLARPMVHLPHFIPAPTPNWPQTEATAPEPPYFLYVGRLETLKGVHTLLPVFQRYPQARLLIAGSGSQLEVLKTLAAGATNIHFLGERPYAELQRLYRGAVAILMPSLCYEVASLVMLEAFSHQTPVIARRLGGMTELIEDSDGGFTYTTDAELMSALDRLLADPGYRREVGQRAYQAYQRHWTVEAHLARYLQLIHDLHRPRQ